MLRVVLLVCVVGCLLSFAAGPVGFSLEKRVPLTTSRVVGSPEPPPPYRTRRVFDKVPLRQPVYVISHPAHDRLFLVELAGKIVLLEKGKDKAETFVEEKGVDFYGMTFHPRYRDNKFVFVFANRPNDKKKRNNVIFRYKADGLKLDPASKKVILEWESNGHNGGDLCFGADGMLYISAGDGTSDSDGDNTGQDLRDLCSGIIRIDVDRPDKGKSYAIPKDNPFLHIKDARHELWAFGLRNPWRMSFDPKTNDLYIGDVGQDVWEMIYLGKRGANYGWSVREGSHDFYPLRKKGPAAFVDPLIEHPHSEARSITGGVVYRGKRYPDLVGTYIYGDYATGKIWGLKQKGGKLLSRGEVANTRLQMVGFGADNDGEIYIVDHGGQLHLLEAAPKVVTPTKFPRKLSETGLFLSTAENTPQPALIPYDVNSPLWSDGATKERFIALPGEETIGFDETGFWKFPEKTVLVKTFALDTPRGKKRIETRLMLLQEGEWVGYSYAWNEAQNDAVLVETGGRDAVYRQVVDGKERELKWRYPSRVECMVCHTRAANYVLGVGTAQMNRDHDYGGTKMNQLEALEKLRVLRTPRAKHLEAWQQRSKFFSEAIKRSLPLKMGETANKRLMKALTGPPVKGETHLLARLPEEMPRLVDPLDEKASLDSRARSYLHANCAHCHVWAGGGNAAIDLHMNTTREKMKLFGETPIHSNFGIDGAKLVVPGVPEKSILLERLTRRGRGQMPPLASSKADDAIVSLFQKWVRGMK